MYCLLNCLLHCRLHSPWYRLVLSDQSQMNQAGWAQDPAVLAVLEGVLRTSKTRTLWLWLWHSFRFFAKDLVLLPAHSIAVVLAAATTPARAGLALESK